MQDEIDQLRKGRKEMNDTVEKLDAEGKSIILNSKSDDII